MGFENHEFLVPSQILLLFLVVRVARRETILPTRDTTFLELTAMWTAVHPESIRDLKFLKTRCEDPRKGIVMRGGSVQVN